MKSVSSPAMIRSSVLLPEPLLPITPIFQDVVELFKTSQTTNSPTLLVSYGGPFGENYFYAKGDVHDDAKLRRFMPHESVDARTRRRGSGGAGWFLDEEHVFSKHAEFIAKLVQDSARAGVGSHGQLQGLGYHWELRAIASGGISMHDALRVATTGQAVGFGMFETLAILGRDSTCARIDRALSLI